MYGVPLSMSSSASCRLKILWKLGHSSVSWFLQIGTNDWVTIIAHQIGSKRQQKGSKELVLEQQGSIDGSLQIASDSDFR